MFGKGQGALGTWLKEFCQLVFIQTIQAFLYAFIIILIVNIIKQNATIVKDADDYRTGLGLMCVFALVSVFKIEDILRKIVGFGPTKADHGGAVRSIAKTAFAMQLGKRVLDNGKKVVGGAGRLIKSGSDAKKAKKQMEEDKADLKADIKGGLNPEHKADYGSSYDASSSGAGRGSSSNYNQRMRALQRENAAKLSEIKKQRAAAIKDMASGVMEFGGAVYGGTMGAIIGGADGNLDEAAQGLIAGAGLGDMAGQMVVNVTAETGGFLARRGNDIKSAYKTSKGAVSDYKESKASGVGTGESIKHAARNVVSNNFFQTSAYKAEIKKLKDEIEHDLKKVDSSADNAND